ncbi:MAG: Integrase, catalytic region, partial [uncultured Acetobacteraceae bacterium]
ASPAGQQLHQPGPAWLAQGQAGGDPGDAAGVRHAGRCGGNPCRLGGVAGRPGGTLRLARRTAAPTHAPRVGQPHRPQDGRDGGLALPARHHAALHSARRQLAEHGRVHPAHPQATHPRRPAPAEPGRDRRLVRADCPGLEPAAHALPLERQAPAKAAKAVRRRTRCRRLGRSYPAATTTVRPRTAGMAQPEASGPL